jgi:hypothetical protein
MRRMAITAEGDDAAPFEDGVWIVAGHGALRTFPIPMQRLGAGWTDKSGRHPGGRRCGFKVLRRRRQSVAGLSPRHNEPQRWGRWARTTVPSDTTIPESSQFPEAASRHVLGSPRSDYKDAMGMVGAAGIEVAAAVSVPLFAFILNWRERARHGYALSAAADFALALAAFDLVALVYSNVFTEVMRNAVFKHSFNQVIIPLFCGTLVTWVCIFLRLEHRMTEGYDFQSKRYLTPRPMGAFLSGWTLLAVFLGMHIFAFVYE